MSIFSAKQRQPHTEMNASSVIQKINTFLPTPAYQDKRHVLAPMFLSLLSFEEWILHNGRPERRRRHEIGLVFVEINVFAFSNGL